MFVFISKIAAFLTFLAAFNGVIAQNATWLIDQELRLQFFNSGKTTPITHHKVNNILTGGDFFIYTSPIENIIRVWQDTTYILHRFATSEIKTTRYLTLDNTNNILSVIYDDVKQPLSLGIPSTDGELRYALADSVLAWVDYDGYFKIFYNSEVSIEGRYPIIQFDANYASVFWLTENDALFIWKNGQEIEIDNNASEYFIPGDNFVAYKNKANDFIIWDAGNTTLAEENWHNSFEVGKNIAAWVAYDNSFKLYANNQITELLPVAPRSFTIVDNTLIFIDDLGFFNIWYQGKNYKVAPYTPTSFKCDFEGVVAFTDNDGRLHCFYEGDIRQISNLVLSTNAEQTKYNPQIAQNYNVTGRVIVYFTQNGLPNIYWNKQNY